MLGFSLKSEHARNTVSLFVLMVFREVQPTCYITHRYTATFICVFFLLHLFPVPPVCTPKGVKVYGVAKMETAHIACKVEANPPEVRFRWTFNNSAEAKQVEERFIHTNHSRSVLTFTPTRTLEYGTLMCWSRNDVGEQRNPCVFHIIAAGKKGTVRPDISQF